MNPGDIQHFHPSFYLIVGIFRNSVVILSKTYPRATLPGEDVPPSQGGGGQASDGLHSGA